MHYPDDFLNKKIKKRIEDNNYRQLDLFDDGRIDFVSNDYLGIVKEQRLSRASNHQYQWSLGSRLLGGHHRLYENTESKIACFHEASAALMFNSGYVANLGVLSAVPQRGDSIIYDQMVHASIRDGIRLSHAKHLSYKHLDCDNLERKLKIAQGNVFVVTESVFSTTGDISPLSRIVQLTKKYKAHLIVDEAHSIGIIGQKGEGLCQYLGLHQDIFARIYTYGKAVGCYGASVVGSERLKNYLTNFARCFVYSTALPPYNILQVNHSYDVFPTLTKERKYLQSLVAYFTARAKKSNLAYSCLPSMTHIQSMIIPCNSTVKKVAHKLLNHRVYVKPLLSPSVEKGHESLRINLHVFNTYQDIDILFDALSFILNDFVHEQVVTHKKPAQ
ncbi:MAG: pyridoxal phosphate-dependent aminotransferase family protein [Phycisphaerales bacterium]|nr:pyridoxal phosphate-dependent aminotransferase family protein [Phycisphaerales bacterium]